MWHDVTIDLFHPTQGSRREVVKVDAVGGDDAVEKGMIEATALAAGLLGYKIVGVAPSGAPPYAPMAIAEGDDVPDEAPKRRGRPPRAPAPPVVDASAVDAAVARIMADDDDTA